LNPAERTAVLTGHTPARPPHTTAQLETKAFGSRTLVVCTNTLAWPGVGESLGPLCGLKSITEIFHFKGVILFPRCAV